MRDLESQKGAIERPWGSSFGREHFPGPCQNAAALCESLNRRYPFVNGNKRTGVTIGSYLLSTFGYEVEATQQELEDFGMDVGQGVLDLGQISRWFENHAESARTSRKGAMCALTTLYLCVTLHALAGE